MAGIITGSINLSNIPKDKIIDGKKGNQILLKLILVMLGLFGGMV